MVYFSSCLALSFMSAQSISKYFMWWNDKWPHLRCCMQKMTENCWHVLMHFWAVRWHYVPLVDRWRHRSYITPRGVSAGGFLSVHYMEWTSLEGKERCWDSGWHQVSTTTHHIKLWLGPVWGTWWAATRTTITKSALLAHYLTVWSCQKCCCQQPVCLCFCHRPRFRW